MNMFQLLPWVITFSTFVVFLVAVYHAPELAFMVRKARRRFYYWRHRNDMLPRLEDMLPQLLVQAKMGIFHPHVFYNEPGDMFEVYWSSPDEQVYREYLNPSMSIMRESESKKIVGCTIEGVHRILQYGESCPAHSKENCEPSEVI